MISREVSFIHHGCEGRATGHHITMDGFHALVISPHFSCNKSHPGFKNLDQTSLYCDRYDMALIPLCADSGMASLDTTFTADLRNLDSVVAGGHGKYGQLFQGHVSGKCKPSQHKHIPWTNTTFIGENEYYITGYQDEGMSGGPVINGCGYAGMTHVVAGKAHLGFAGVISAESVKACFRKHAGKVKSCPGAKVVSVKTFPFTECPGNNLLPSTFEVSPQ